MTVVSWVCVGIAVWIFGFAVGRVAGSSEGLHEGVALMLSVLEGIGLVSMETEEEGEETAEEQEGAVE